MALTKVVLDESEMPTRWYNITADLPRPPDPPLDPKNGKPLNPEALQAIFPRQIIEQEMSAERFIEIPEEVLKIYRLWRPTPLYRARRLEEFLGTPARIYYKYEGGSPAGSHKPNTAVAQAYYNRREGVRRLATETGAGQWGSALAFACNLFGLQCSVYMVRVSYEQKPYRRILMESWGAEVLPSPTNRTEAGRKYWQAIQILRGAWGSALARRSKTPRPTRIPTTPWAVS
jgi:tryptophan synthase beta chain